MGNRQPEISEWWTPKELAARWWVSVSTVTRLLEASNLKGKKVGAQWRIHATAIDAYEADGIPKPRETHKVNLSAFENVGDYV